MSFAVVIPSARAANLVSCVESLRAREPALTPDRIVVVDDGARAGGEARVGQVSWISGVKPFVFARNVNLGIRACTGDVILLNDDARLLTPRGFEAWSQMMAAHPKIGVCSAGIQGVVGNPRQHAAARGGLSQESSNLAFVCVYIPRRVFEAVGLLDERFVGYGFDDDDFCERTRAAGYELGIWHGCVVNHDGTIPSSYRTRSDVHAMMEKNRRIMQAKRAESRAQNDRSRTQHDLSTKPGTAPPAPTVRSDATARVDLMYIAWNRLEFTRESFDALLKSTDWTKVRELVVYDDGSSDGTREWLEQNVGRVPAPHRMLCTSFGSPVTAMVHFIEHSAAPILAKLDNDAVYPPGWLTESLDVLDRNPELSLLGIEAMYPHEEKPAAPRGYAPGDFVSGLGLYRREAFAASRPAAFQKYFGLEEWQMTRGPLLRRGWITPALPVFLLDRMPIEPWRRLSLEYVQRGWQRPWPSYPADCTLWHWRWPPAGARAEAAAALSAGSDGSGNAGVRMRDGLRLNVLWCGEPLAGYTNVSLGASERDDVVDLSGVWPWENDSAQEIRAWNVIERLRDKINTMNELWRVLRDGGTVELVLPTTDGPGAFQDPTQVSYWNRRSFLYYEEGSPYRERLAQRYGIKARFSVVTEHIEATIDGPRLTITLRAMKAASSAATSAESRSTEASASTAPVLAASPGGAPEFMTAMRVKNEAEHIREAIESVLPLCERVIVFDDHSSDGTAEIVQSFGPRCELLRSPFQGLDEARDKNHVLDQLLRANPAWVLWIDGDEALERGGPAALRAAARASRAAVYSLRIAYLWDQPSRVRVDGVYGKFARPSFFLLRGQDPSRIRFPATGAGGNFHCGNVPAGLSGRQQTLSVRLKHYGYMTAEQRAQKYQFYTTIDPNNRAEDNYRHLAGIRGARHAPGPPVFVPWRE